MVKTFKISLVFMLLCILLQSHDFWLQPDKFQFNVGEIATINFWKGGDFIGEIWMDTKASVISLNHFNKAITKDLKPQLKDVEKDRLKVTLSKEGTHLFVMETTSETKMHSASSLSKYAEENALDEVVNQLIKNGESGDSIIEHATFHTKLVLQAGKMTDDTFKKEVGFPVEIIPERNPYTAKKGMTVRFKILYKGKPYFGAKVKVWNRHNNRTTIQNIFAQQDGMIETHISNPGAWMLSVVKMIPGENSGEWKSFNGSLVFGIK
jgi:uncharacterized GH25 family protein